MSDQEVIRLAREAGLIHYYDSEGQWSGVTNENLIEQHKNRNDDRLVEILAPFAALAFERGAAAEREACAQILDRNADACRNNSMLEDVLRSNAAAIRARSRDGN